MCIPIIHRALQRRSKNKTDCHNADNHQIPTSSSTQELQALIKQDDMIGELNLPLLSPKLDQISTSALTSNVAPVDAKDLIDVGARWVFCMLFECCAEDTHCINSLAECFTTTTEIWSCGLQHICVDSC